MGNLDMYSKICAAALCTSSRRRLARSIPASTEARTTLAVITARGRKVATDATRELNAMVYERIGLSEDKRHLLTDLLAELRAIGNEFGVGRSSEVIEQVGSRQACKRKRRGKNQAEVA